MNSGSTSGSSLNPESDVDLKKESCVKHVDVLWFCYCESAALDSKMAANWSFPEPRAVSSVFYIRNNSANIGYGSRIF